MVEGDSHRKVPGYVSEFGKSIPIVAFHAVLPDLVVDRLSSRKVMKELCRSLVVLFARNLEKYPCPATGFLCVHHVFRYEYIYIYGVTAGRRFAFVYFRWVVEREASSLYVYRNSQILSKWEGGKKHTGFLIMPWLDARSKPRRLIPVSGGVHHSIGVGKDRHYTVNTPTRTAKEAI